MAQYFLMSCLGFSGAYLYNNRDLLDDLRNNGIGALGNHLNSIASKDHQSSQRNQTELIEKLRQEITELKIAQRRSQTIIYPSQQSSFFGIDSWKFIFLMITFGSIYWKVKGYQSKELISTGNEYLSHLKEYVTQKFTTFQWVISFARIPFL
eukprot:c22677_g1_i1.p1 GENE.c22677_g1_i1~~c22677_g1_i1.p1  ORF type:complete len:152 (-),score=17.88 c22677_g1_i1:89-544(-)